MGILSKRTNKKYDYEPRYYKAPDGRKPFELKHAFDEHRTTIQKVGLKGKINNALDDYKKGSDVTVRNRMYIIIAILVLLFLWVIDFDLTIFKP